jgi:hypothetical protein
MTCSNFRSQHHQNKSGGSLRRLKAELQTFARQASSPGIDWEAHSPSASHNLYSHREEHTSWIAATG